MNPEEYRTRRAELINAYYRLKQLRLNRSAAARVRQIAQLDLEFDNIPIERTKALFNYGELLK
jgi:hypothetical protein